MTLLTEAELAKELNVSPWTVRRWRFKMQRPHIRPSKQILYRLSAVSEWLISQEQTNCSPV